jgi:hypothetical protein
VRFRWQTVLAGRAGVGDNFSFLSTRPYPPTPGFDGWMLGAGRRQPGTRIRSSASGGVEQLAPRCTAGRRLPSPCSVGPTTSRATRVDQVEVHGLARHLAELLMVAIPRRPLDRPARGGGW